LLLKVIYNEITVYLLAVSDVVRTSLGPRGMDKMVRFHICFKDL
jgi:chaperonin GroEL (HSP60 family)